MKIIIHKGKTVITSLIIFSILLLIFFFNIYINKPTTKYITDLDDQRNIAAIINYYKESKKLPPDTILLEYWHSIPFPVEDWKRLNPPGFEYLAEYFIKNKSIPEDILYFNMYCYGFIEAAGIMSISDDINAYSSLMKTNPEKLAALSLFYPAIKKKTDMITQYYNNLQNWKKKITIQ